MSNIHHIKVQYRDNNNNYRNTSKDIRFEVPKTFTYIEMNIPQKIYYYNDTVQLNVSVKDQNDNIVKYGQVQFYFIPNSSQILTSISSPKNISKDGKISLLHIPTESGRYIAKYIENDYYYGSEIQDNTTKYQITLKRIPTKTILKTPPYINKKQSINLISTTTNNNDDIVKYGVVNFFHYDKDDGNEKNISNPILIEDDIASIQYSPSQDNKWEFLKSVYNFDNQYKYYEESRSSCQKVKILENEQIFTYIVDNNNIDLSGDIPCYTASVKDKIVLRSVMTDATGELIKTTNPLKYTITKLNSNDPTTTTSNANIINQYAEVTLSQKQPGLYKVTTTLTGEDQPTTANVLTKNGKISNIQQSISIVPNRYSYIFNVDIKEEIVHTNIDYHINNNEITFNLITNKTLDQNIALPLNVKIEHSNNTITEDTIILENNEATISIDLNENEYKCNIIATFNEQNIDNIIQYKGSSISFEYAPSNEITIWDSYVQNMSYDNDEYPGEISLVITGNLHSKANIMCFNVDVQYNNQIYNLNTESYYMDNQTKFYIDKENEKTIIKIDQLNENKLLPGDYTIKVTPDSAYTKQYLTQIKPLSRTNTGIDDDKVTMLHDVYIAQGSINISLPTNIEISKNNPNITIKLIKKTNFSEVPDNCLVVYIKTDKDKYIRLTSDNTNINTPIYNGNECYYTLTIPEEFLNENKTWEYYVHFYGDIKYISSPSQKGERNINKCEVGNTTKIDEDCVSGTFTVVESV